MGLKETQIYNNFPASVTNSGASSQCRVLQLSGQVTTGAKPKQSRNEEKHENAQKEVDCQNLVIAKLIREIEEKTKGGSPEACTRDLRERLCNEKLKLEAMLKSVAGDKAMSPSEVSDASVLSDYDCLENDRYELQEKVLQKERALEAMEMKISVLQCQLMKICHENKTMAEKLTNAQGTKDCQSQQELKTKLGCYVDTANKLACSVHTLEAKLCELRNELDCVKKDKQAMIEVQESVSCVSVKEKGDCMSSRPKTCPCNIGDNQTARKLKSLQSQYANLLTEFCRKEKTCKDMSERMSKALTECKGDEERVLNEALKKRVDEMIAEVKDYKLFIKELQEQIEMYREKFMTGKEN